MSPLRLAWLNIRRQKLISILLVFSMSLAFGAVGLLYRVEMSENQRWSRIAIMAPLIVGPKQSGIEQLLAAGLLEAKNLQLIPFRLFETIRGRQNIQFEDKATVSNGDIDLAVPLLFMGKIKDLPQGKNDFAWLIGSDFGVAEMLRRQNLGLQSGTWFFTDAGDFAEGVVIGAKVGKALKETLEIDWTDPTGNRTGMTSKLPVLGILKESNTAWDNVVLADYHMGWKMYDTLGAESLAKVSIWGSSVLHYFLASTRNGEYKTIQSLINQRSVALLSVLNQEKEKLSALLGNTEELGLLISGMILVVCFIVIFALMILRFQIQSGSIAILRALGVKDSRLRSWFFLESILLLIPSLAIGAALTCGLWQWTSHLLSGSVLAGGNPPLEWPVWVAGSLAFLVSLSGPYLLISKQDLHESLRV